MSRTPRPRATVASVLRRAFAPHAMSTIVSPRGAAWVPAVVRARPEPRTAPAAGHAETPATRVLAAANA